jgi:transcriptional regulator GlxA family with amidase domain
MKMNRTHEVTQPAQVSPQGLSINHRGPTRAQAAEPGQPVFPVAEKELREENNQAVLQDADLASWRKIELTVAYMAQHLDQPLQVASLARMAGTSPSHFFVLFKRWAGFSPIDYFIRLRMQKASRLLASTSMSVKEIAANLGYGDPLYFSRLFRSFCGVAPSGYRMNMVKSGAPRADPVQRPSQAVSEMSAA